MYAYQFFASRVPVVVGYGDPQYSNNLFQYCSVEQLTMAQYLSYPVDPGSMTPVSQLFERLKADQ
jgi:hypothetical protein